MVPESLSAWIQRQPNNVNLLRPNGFKFVLNRAPKTSFFCQKASFPGLKLGVATQATPLVDIPYPGEKITFDELVINFLVQEDLANYAELFNWMTGIGFPESQTQFAKLERQQQKASRKDPSLIMSDATLIVLDSEYKESGSLFFKDCFPVYLSGMEFASTETGVTYFQAEARFRYTNYTLFVHTEVGT